MKCTHISASEGQNEAGIPSVLCYWCQATDMRLIYDRRPFRSRHTKQQRYGFCPATRDESRVQLWHVIYSVEPNDWQGQIQPHHAVKGRRECYTRENKQAACDTPNAKKQKKRSARLGRATRKCIACKAAQKRWACRSSMTFTLLNEQHTRQ